MNTKRKFPAIDIIKLYAKWDIYNWNEWLTQKYEESNINDLAEALYGLQVGMSIVSKKKLNDEKLDIWFVRICRSIENTAKSIIRKKTPNSLDLPPIPGQIRKLTDIDAKRKRDMEFTEFLKRSRF